MKILLISNMYPSGEHPTYGIFVKNFHDQLSRQDFILEKVVISGKEKSVIQKIRKYITFFRHAVRKIRRNEYDLIYVHYCSHSLLPFLFIKFPLPKPLIINAHGSDILPGTQLGFIIHKLVAPVLARTNLLVVPSGYFFDVAHGKSLLKKEDIYISPSGGIDTTLFRPMENLVSREIFTVGYVSRIDKGKGWEILLDSIALLKNRNIRLLIIGGGSEEPALLKKINQLKIGDIVDFKGAMPQRELPNYFNQMDLFVFPSLSESLGLVGLEAMACGVPVVGSNIPGLNSYIRDGYNGRTFEPRNIKELAGLISEFMEADCSQLKEYSRNAIETSKQYDSQQVAADMAEKIKAVYFKSTLHK